MSEASGPASRGALSGGDPPSRFGVAERVGEGPRSREVGVDRVGEGPRSREVGVDRVGEGPRSRAVGVDRVGDGPRSREVGVDGIAAGDEGLLVDTLRALGAPRRLIPILLVSSPLVAAQHSLSRDPLGMPLGVLMCVCFAFGAPYLWRRCMPEGTWREGLVRLLTYGLLGVVVVGVLGVVLPRVLGVGTTFLTGRESLTVSLALFWVGGWGLGRDIELERRLERERARAEALAREAERAQLLALRAHLDPHFLFNTLNAIAEWCREDGAVAEAAVLRLSSMLRTILAGVHLAAWPLAREVELCRDLFELHRIRDPDRFVAEVVMSGAIERAQVPPMILLPLAENAIKHGPAAGHRGPVTLSVRVDDDRVTAQIDNPGRYAGPRPGGEGLPTIEKRLALAYGGDASLSIGAVEERTVATVVVPLRAPVAAV